MESLEGARAKHFSACEDEHSRRILAEGVQDSGCKAQGCTVPDCMVLVRGCMVLDCKAPAVHMKAEQQEEVASSHPAAGRTEVLVHIEVLVRTAAAVAAQATGIHHWEGREREIGCSAGDAAEAVLDKASWRPAVVGPVQQRRRQQPDVLREASFGCKESVQKSR